MDSDFEERMFAKQIAVMKGQAWNVVEALKTSDHGPLELTRRTKVCVWDDLVDVPVAVPMRVTSSELRRENLRHSMDEVDIASSAPARGVPVDDLLGVTASAPVDMPHPGRFEISTPAGDNAQSPEETSMNNSGILSSPSKEITSPARPTMQAQGYRGSYQGQARSLNVYEPARQRQRRYSYATSVARRNSNTIAQQLYGDSHDVYDDGDLDGDLGYAAAEGQMGNRRKVIVERLEPVKTRNPVFTWC